MPHLPGKLIDFSNSVTNVWQFFEATCFGMAELCDLVQGKAMIGGPPYFDTYPFVPFPAGPLPKQANTTKQQVCVRVCVCERKRGSMAGMGESEEAGSSDCRLGFAVQREYLSWTETIEQHCGGSPPREPGQIGREA